MCGVPHHSAEGYIGRLVKGGKRVAIAEQTTIPQPGKLVERELTRVISAGTLADMNLLDSSRHNYIVALYKDKKRFGLACVDHTTGNFPWPSSNTWICFWTSCPASIPPNSWSATSRRTASPEPTPRFITTDILFCLPRPFPIC